MGTRKISLEKLAERFSTKPKCDEFRRRLGKREWEIYWKDTGGVIIRESEAHDGIGNQDVFATIQLCDWLGWNCGEVKKHTYTFAVFLYVNGSESGYTMCNTIEEAIEDYKRTCSRVMQIIKSGGASGASL